MRMVKRWDFVPKEGKVPLFSIADMVKRKEGEAWDETYPVEVMTIRNKDGLYTKAYHQLLLDMGFPPQRDVEKWCVCWEVVSCWCCSCCVLSDVRVNTRMRRSVHASLVHLTPLNSSMTSL